jgi:hypothetical protein
MRIAVLYDGDGKLRAALEAAGHDCVGFEPNDRKYQIGLMVGSGRVVNRDPKGVNFDAYDAVVVNGKRKWTEGIPNKVNPNELSTSSPAAVGPDDDDSAESA